MHINVNTVPTYLELYRLFWLKSQACFWCLEFMARMGLGRWQDLSECVQEALRLNPIQAIIQ